MYCVSERILDILLITTVRFLAEILLNKKLSYRREIVRCAMSLEIFSTAVQLYEKSHLKRLAISNDLEGHSRSSASDVSF